MRKRVIRVTMVLGLLTLVAMILSLFLFEMPVVRFFLWISVILNSTWLFLWQLEREDAKKKAKKEAEQASSPKNAGKKKK